MNQEPAFSPPPLMAILDTEAAARAGWSVRDLAAAFLDGGATFLQLRAKEMASGPLFDLAQAVVSLAHGAGARVVVNDRADLARMSGADGVHVGQDDLPPNAARVVVGATAIVGLSTHTPEQVEGATRQPVTYAALGPIFATNSKATGYDSRGLAAVRAAAERLRTHGLPLVAIGGITLDTAASVLEAGAASVAVIGDLLATGDPAARVRAYLQRLTV